MDQQMSDHSRIESGVRDARPGGDGAVRRRIAAITTAMFVAVVAVLVMTHRGGADTTTPLGNGDETIALSPAGSLMSLIGALVLAAGVVVAAVAVESRGRDEADGELMGRA